MSKITEKTLRDECQAANTGVLKTADFGLKVEKCGDQGFRVMKMYRLASRGQERLTLPASPKETKAFITGFAACASILIGGK